MGGASAAAPIVAGVVGLMLSANAGLSRTQILTTLRNTADKIDAGAAAYDATGFSPTHGYGRVNAAAAVKTVANPGTRLPDPDPELPDPGPDAGDWEIGARAGLTWLVDGGTTFRAGLPGSGPWANPILHATWLGPATFDIEFQLGFDHTNPAGAGADETQLVFAVQPAYVFAAGYFAPNIALRYHTIGSSSVTWGGAGAAAGLRWLPLSYLALRTELRYRYWPSPKVHELGASMGFGVVF
jgi:hypothetical protein